jgi:glycerol-3-phosphate dehydrogenase
MHELAKMRTLTPIIEQVYKVLFLNKNPHQATEKLMTRVLKEEKR